MGRRARAIQGRAMKKVFVIVTFIFSCAWAQVEPGELAPDFQLKSASGKEFKLSELKGKIVVLEWLNHGCPFVRNHYDSGNMQDLQKEYASKDVAWISIISSSKGKQGFSTPDKALQDKQKHGSKAKYILLDMDGKVGKSFGAKATPHMVVIDKKGKIAYQGAIDSIPSTKKEDIGKAVPYVRDALEALLSGKQIKIKETRAYGCSIKY